MANAPSPDQLRALIQRIEALQERLGPYVQHSPSCPRPHRKCECGLAAFFHAATEPDSAFADIVAFLAPKFRRRCADGWHWTETAEYGHQVCVRCGYEWDFPPPKALAPVEAPRTPDQHYSQWMGVSENIIVTPSEALRTGEEDEPCVCQIDDGLVQEWVSKVRAVALQKGFRTAKPRPRTQGAEG